MGGSGDYATHWTAGLWCKGGHSDCLEKRVELGVVGGYAGALWTLPD